MPKRYGKNNLMSKEGLKLLEKASGRAVADINRRTNPAPTAQTPPPPPGANSPRQRLEEERVKQLKKIQTGNVRKVRPGSTQIGPLSGMGGSGRGGSGGGGGGWMDQIR